MGGFAGYTSFGNLSNSYSTNTVNGINFIGGFVGGDFGGSYSGNFWDIQIDGGSYDDSGNSGDLTGINPSYMLYIYGNLLTFSGRVPILI